MKTWELQPNGALESLTVVDRPSPAVGPNDVKVRVKAVSLNFRDLNVAKNAKGRTRSLVPVSDGAGEVIAVGANVTRWKPGARVVASFFPTWLDGELSDAHHAAALGAGAADGMLREEVVLPESAWLEVPEHLTFEQAATLPCAGVTAWQALYEVASLKAGDTVLLQGSGGVSVFALQLARAAGATVLVTSTSPAKHAMLRELGAHQVIDSKAEPKWGEAAKALTRGRGVDIVVDVGGPSGFDQSVAALRYGGTMSMLGVLSGFKGEVNLYSVFHKRAKVCGVYVGSVAMFERFLRAVRANRLVPVVDQVFDAAQVQEAYAHLQAARHIGKVVIRLG